MLMRATTGLQRAVVSVSGRQAVSVSKADAVPMPAAVSLPLAACSESGSRIVRRYTVLHRNCSMSKVFHVENLLQKRGRHDQCQYLAKW